MYHPELFAGTNLDPRDYQIEALDNLRGGFREGHRRQLVCAPTGAGKCHPAGTMVLCWGGTQCPVEKVQPGMALMGPDSQPRFVTSISQGHGPLAEIIPTKGEPWGCNLDHVLTLVRTNSKGERFDGSIIDVSLREWMGWSKTRKHVHKLFRVGVEFPDWAHRELPVDPYLLGLLLGDGSLTHGTPGVTTADREIVRYCERMAPQFGCHIREHYHSDKTPQFYFAGSRGHKNALTEALRELSLYGHGSHTKEIPERYLLAPRVDRMALLAGMLDTDGHLDHGSFEIISASPYLADGISYLSRSLGFASYRKPKHVSYRGTRRLYWRVTVSGDVDQIPTLLPRKQAAERKQKKDVLRTGFSVRHMGCGDYYGFTLTGDGRYLLGDFTVTHNTLIAALTLKAASDRRTKSAFIADRISLVDQTSIRLREAGVPHGVRQAEKGRKGEGYDYPVHVWSAQTMEPALRAGNNVLDRYGLVIVDEAHGKRQQIIEAIMEANVRTIGLSATPFTTGLGKIYTNLVNVRTTDWLTEQGWLVPVEVYRGVPLDVASIKLKNGEFDRDDAADKTLKIVGDAISEWVKYTGQYFPGRIPKTLVFSNSVADGEVLATEYRNIGIRAEQLSYRDKDDKRRRHVIEGYRAGDIDMLVSVDMLSKGFDVADVECLQFVRPFRKSIASVIQQLGRGMRIAPGKKLCLVLDHAGNYFRFLPRIDRFFAHGLDSLDPGVIKQINKTANKEDPEERQCPKCGYAIPKGARECPMCGWRKQKRQETGHVPGKMVKVERISKQVGDLWPHICAFAQTRYDFSRPDEAQERAVKFARIQYKSMTGKWPPWGIEFDPADQCHPAVEEMIRQQLREYGKEMARKNAIAKAMRKRDAARAGTLGLD